MTVNIGRIGIWSIEVRFGDRAEAADAAAELEDLGYGAIWTPGGVGGEVLADIDFLLAATSRAAIATGILNVWKHEPADVAGWWKALPADKQDRVLLGLGVSHAPLIGDDYVHAKPLTVMRDYLDQLSEAGLPTERATCLAALRAKMQELARDRTTGAHPFLVTPEHSARARAVLGPGKLLAPEQGVVLDSNPDTARATARGALEQYLQFPNYVNSWLALGFAQDEITQMSDRFVDALFAWGSADKIAERVNAHLAAGADHVCMQVITGAGVDFGPARQAWRALAKALL